MLPKENRIAKEKDFEKIFKGGASFKENFLILKIISNNSQINRFGFVISKKVSKNAVVRNRIKRQLSELVKLQKDKIKKGFDGVFIILPGLENKDFWELEEILKNLFKKAKLIVQEILNG